jgi:hypothetical protein
VIPGLTQHRSIVNSTQITGQLYATAVALAASALFFMHPSELTIPESYDMATPVLVRTKPILESADGLAVAT